MDINTLQEISTQLSQSIANGQGFGNGFASPFSWYFTSLYSILSFVMIPFFAIPLGLIFMVKFLPGITMESNKKIFKTLLKFTLIYGAFAYLFIWLAASFMDGPMKPEWLKQNGETYAIAKKWTDEPIEKAISLSDVECVIQRLNKDIFAIKKLQLVFGATNIQGQDIASMSPERLRVLISLTEQKQNF